MVPAGSFLVLLLAAAVVLEAGGDPLLEEEVLLVWPLSSADGPEVEVPVNESQVTLLVTWDTAPANPKWLDPNMFPVVEGANSSFQVNTTDSRSFLVIRNVQVDMSGTYTLVDELQNRTTNATIKVYGTPQAHMSHKKLLTYLKAKEEHPMVCTAQGFPTPNITWFFSACHEEDIRNCKPDLKPLPADKVSEAKVLDADRGVVESTARFWADSWGDLICEACNEHGCSIDEQAVIPSDLSGDEGFVLEGPDTVPAGKKVEFTCAVSKVGWILKTEWFFSKDGEAPRLVQQALPDAIFLPWITRYSFFSKIAIPRAGPQHAGNYTCIHYKQYWNHERSHVLAVTQE